MRIQRSVTTKPKIKGGGWRKPPKPKGKHNVTYYEREKALTGLPVSSWWAVPTREQFMEKAKIEHRRMRTSKFGQVQADPVIS